jgi:hypothetical protein
MRWLLLVTLTAIPLATLACASDESMAIATLRAYSKDSTSGSIDRAFALMESQAQRICPREMFGATIEFDRSNSLRQTNPITISDVQAKRIPAVVPDGLVLDLTVTVLSDDRGPVEFHKYVGAVKEDGRWKLTATRCLGVFP